MQKMNKPYAKKSDGLYVHAGDVVVVQRSLQLLKQQQQPLLQCTALVSQLQRFLKGESAWTMALGAFSLLNGFSGLLSSPGVSPQYIS